jgi:hypothetical protein
MGGFFPSTTGNCDLVSSHLPTQIEHEPNMISVLLAFCTLFLLSHLHTKKARRNTFPAGFKFGFVNYLA